MSNDDSTPPNAPRDDSETGLGRLGQDPTEDRADSGSLDETAVFSTPDLDEPTPPGGGVPVDATQVMPTTPAAPSLPSENPTIVGGAIPPGSPMMASGPTTTTVPLGGPPPKWYQQPGLVAGVLLGLLAIGALGIFLFLANDGDDADLVADGETEPVTLSITRIDANGNPLGTTLAAEVTAADAVPFTWLSPADVPDGEPGRLPTDATGRAEFRWAPADTDVDGFESSVAIREFVAGVPGTGDFVESVVGVCTIDTDGEPAPLDVDTSLVADTSNDSTTQAGEYTFPNATFSPGDRIECTLNDVGPGDPASTTVPFESTTVPDTAVVDTTTVPETTVPPTTVPETTTTTTTTTTSTTSTTTTTLAPEPEAPVLGDVLRAEPDLSQALVLLTRVGLLDDLENASQPFTLFVPDNAAIDALRDGTDAPDLDDDDVVRSILQAHLSRGQAFTSQQIAGVSSIPVEGGRPQPVDGAANPPTIGGVPIVALDLEAEGGVVHVLGGVLQRL